MGQVDVLEVLLIIFYPCLGIWYHAKECNIHVYLCFVVTAFFYIPGFLYALIYCCMCHKNARGPAAR
ncbi:hypothetical protein QR680_018160 [Steinernema hermaphroditum]|uniref:Uncharacterized protein n=1 Tax=Steinernema hermaphroditum TaxID=289476 RepID=A0AA39HH26_9BILA|nr:hypothetical protein QR680_018160 [Steinernema hermaphroditum]